jgi:hypothetical protein
VSANEIFGLHSVIIVGSSMVVMCFLAFSASRVSKKNTKSSINLKSKLNLYLVSCYCNCVRNNASICCVLKSSFVMLHKWSKSAELCKYI